MAKKWTAVLLIICMSVSVLIGCSSKEQVSEEQASEDTGSETEEEQAETEQESESVKEMKTITDMRGKEVAIPAAPRRVAIFDKGFLVQTMTARSQRMQWPE